MAVRANNSTFTFFRSQILKRQAAKPVKIMDWASPDEMFVKIPRIVELRMGSDDPEFIEPEPVDLFDEQKKWLNQSGETT